MRHPLRYVSPAPTSSHSGQEHALLQIATAAIQLGALGPGLARVAQEMAARSDDQARLARAVADNMRALTTHLEEATLQMRGASGEVEAALATVSRIAQHTKIIAINATIEAARAGAHGVGFGVVVEEVQRLAERTSTTTSEIEQRVRDLQASIARVTAMTTESSVRAFDATADTATSSSVARANERIQEVADAAGRQLAAVGSLKDMSGSVKTMTDTLVMAVGTFRFAAHTRAEQELAGLMREIGGGPLQQARLEAAMARWIERHPHFELAYVVNAAGRQIVNNILCVNGRAETDPAGLHRDWSNRPWYREAIAHPTAHSTDVYRSAATGGFCFTIAAALPDTAGQIRGVLAADVNFRQLLAR
jgi:hypothetical protein